MSSKGAEMMKEYTYVIIGGGMAADAVVQGIRELDASGSICILSKESEPPYKRPPLSKGLWTGDVSLDNIFCETPEYDVDIKLKRTVMAIDPGNRTVTDQVEMIGYKRLMLATGAAPNTLPFEAEGIIYYRTLADYLKLLELQKEKQHFAVVGAGFIGCEIASALASNNRQITMVFPEENIGSAVFPEVLSQALTQLFQSHHVETLPGLKLSDLTSDSGTYTLELESGKKVDVDGVVAGIGVSPQVDLAQDAGLNVDNGIVVDGQLRTSRPDIYAAGDVANFHSRALDQHVRVEHEDNAIKMGKTAGRNMAGAQEIYTHLPLFYSDLFDVGYEAVGELDASLETVGIWNGLHEQNVWAYLKEGRICGVLLWNLFGQADAARSLICSRTAMNTAQVNEALLQLIDDARDE